MFSFLPTKIEMIKIVLVCICSAFVIPTWAKKSKNYQIVGFLGTTLQNQSLTPTIASDGVSLYNATLVNTYENSIIGGLEVRSLHSDDWLLKGGLQSMPSRKVTAASLEVPGYPTQSLIIIQPYSYRLSTLYLDAGYCWESFYLYFGVSYNNFEFNSPGSTVPYRTKNGMGSTFGMGIMLSDNWSIEYASHVANVSVESGTKYENTDKFLFLDTNLSLRFGF